MYEQRRPPHLVFIDLPLLLFSIFHCALSTLLYNAHLSLQNKTKIVFSFFAVQLLANAVVTASVLGQNCASIDATYYLGSNVTYLTSYGVSVIGTNVLCHRYLLEKANAMTNLYVATSVATLLPSFLLRIVLD